MEYSTQETQIASQTYTSQREDEPNDANCWGLLWPIASGNKPVRFNKDKQEYTIGRGPQCDLRISSQIISNIHCRINWDGATGSRAGLTITDLSRNGTWVKGRKIAKGIATLLNNGDDIAFGVQNINSNGESHRYTFRTPVVQRERKGVHVKYELQQELGRGSFAAVYKALQRATGKFFAVKIIPKPQSLLQPSTINMLDREITILKQLKHPNIVALEDVIGSEAELCIVMELISGGDLFEYIVTSPMKHLTEDQTGHLTAEICDAMAYIHYKGITHRDLKPENILLTADNPPHVKVADFGLAKCVNSKTMLRTMCGTPSYLAPEVVLQGPGKEGYDHKVDSWSVGAIVFAMLTGQGAFTEDENQPLTTRVQTRQVTWVYMSEVGCTKAAHGFVNQLLQNRPENRMALADALGHEWLHPAYWPSGVPSYFPNGSPISLINATVGEPVGTPTHGVTEEFQNLEIDSDSISESPAFIEVDFEDANLGGSSGLTRSQELQRSVEEREQSWDIVEEPGADPEQTPLARPRLQLLEEEATARGRPAAATSVPPPPLFPQKSLKRKLSGGDEDDEDLPGLANNSGTESTRAKLGGRKASKVSESDTPTATRSRFPPPSAGRKTTAKNGKGKGPVARDFATEADE